MASGLDQSGTQNTAEKARFASEKFETKPAEILQKITILGHIGPPPQLGELGRWTRGGYDVWGPQQTSLTGPESPLQQMTVVESINLDFKHFPNHIKNGWTLEMEMTGIGGTEFV